MKNLCFAIFVMFFSFQSAAQIQMPMPSPSASVTQQVGMTKISLNYSSPAVKGRKIFGELLPFGTSWRAGANAPTTVEFSTPVKINGKTVNTGKYSIFITPAESGPWTIHLNSKGNAIYSYMKDNKVDEQALAADDAVALKVIPQKTTQKNERLLYTISAGNNKTGVITMLWDDIILPFEVDTAPSELINRMQEAIK
jgi:hypothetical protein